MRKIWLFMPALALNYAAFGCKQSSYIIIYQSLLHIKY